MTGAKWKGVNFTSSFACATCAGVAVEATAYAASRSALSSAEPAVGGGASSVRTSVWLSARYETGAEAGAARSGTALTRARRNRIGRMGRISRG